MKSSQQQTSSYRYFVPPLRVEAENVVTDRQTDRQTDRLTDIRDKYRNPRCACAPRVNEQPTRLDYGKSKYGGPFTIEQVEDVKTFWRILVVVAVISMLYGPTESIYASYPVLKRQVAIYMVSDYRWLTLQR